MPAADGVVTFGSSPAMLAVFDEVQRAAPSPYPILITGETGTGKTLLARHIHELSGRRGAFRSCPIPQLETLGANELRGHLRGSYTGANDSQKGAFELAHLGTLFLDEIGLASQTVQSLLLPLIEEREVIPIGGCRPIPVDVRVISATNEDLDALVTAGQFRKDLQLRLEFLKIAMPPLHEREDDLPMLVDTLLRRIAAENAAPLPAITRGAHGALLQHRWPGNIRELYLILARAFLRAGPGRPIEADHVARALERKPDGRTPTPELAAESLRLKLAECRGNLAAASRALGVSQSTIRRRTRELLGPRHTWGLDRTASGQDRVTP